MMKIGEKMRKILIINTSGLAIGGITTHMYNYIKTLKVKGYESTFTIVVTGIRDEKMLEKFAKLGCKIKYLPDRKKEFLRYIFSLIKLIRIHHFDVIHVHGNSSTMGIETTLARLYGIPIRIAHCHNAKCDHPRMHKLLYPFLNIGKTEALACSKSAGEWIYGRENFIILPNAIDLQKFRYNSEIRNKYRRLLEIDDETLLIGHVGNFNEQKNHKFLINIFYQVQLQKKAKIILIGTGHLLESIKEQVNKLHINDKVIFLGERNDVNCWMQAMDLFVFPSLWEGLPVSLIEAQASGLDCIISDNISKEVIINSKYVSILTLNDITTWKENVCNTTFDYSRKDRYKQLQKMGYDINSIVNQLINIYDGKVRKYYGNKI